MTDDERLAALEQRVAALEAALGPPQPAADADDAGEVGYQGSVHLDGERSWTIRYAAGAVLDLPSATVAEVLAALGHTARLALVRRLLTGPATAAELREAAGLSSTGQLYHHLRALTGARVVAQDGHHYRVPATATVPVMVALVAAADLGGALGTR